MISNYKFVYIILAGLITANLAFSYGYKPKPGKKQKTNQKVSAEDGGVGFEKIAKSLGWETNESPYFVGDPKAIKGGMITMLGDDEYPLTFRNLGKDSRSQVLSLLDYLQNDYLLSFDYETLEYEPQIATHWKISPDSLTYYFRIDPRAKWHDGRDIVAEDYVASYKLFTDDGHKDPNVAKIYRDLFETPVALSKYIIKLTAKKKDWRSFYYAATDLKPWPSYYLNKIDGAGYIEKYNFSFMPGSGPYEYDAESSKKGSYIILKRSDNYWANDHERNIGLFNFDKIKFIFIEDENQQVISFMNGDYDIYPWSRAQWWVQKFTSENYTEIEKGWVQKIKIFNYLAKGPSGVVFNTQKEPWNDIRVRKAFAHVFDVETLNKRLFFDEYVRLNTYFYGTPYANPRNEYIEYSPEKALALLKEVGWTRKEGERWLTNDKGDIFEFNFLIAPGGDRIYTTFQEDLKNIGIKMNFDQRDGNARFATVMKKEYEVSSQGWTGGFFPSPEGTMHSKYADDVEVTNITSMGDPELDKLIETYNAEWDAKKRIPLAHKIDSTAVNQYHYAMGWTSPYGARMLYWNKFDMIESGVPYTGDWRSPLTYWWVDPKKEQRLSNARDKGLTLPKETENIDFWNTQK